MTQEGHYSPSELQYVIEHDGTVLLEVDSFSWDVDPKIEPGGAGLGLQKDTYYKTTGAPKGAWKMDRKKLQRSDKGMLFLDLVAGSRVIISEPIVAASTSYTVALNTTLLSILEIRLLTANVLLREGVDYTVNYVTGVITFAVSTPEAGIIRYLASSRRNQNYLINGGFEDALTNIWIPFTTATIARNSANAYAEGYALAVTPAATNDGVRYNVSMTLQPGRTYRLRGKAKAAAAEVLSAFWNDGSSDIVMTVVSGATLGTAYATFEFTFTATKAVVPSILIKDTKATPALFYIDELVLLDDTTGTNPTALPNPMDAGLSIAPFMFNVLERRVVDGVVIHRFQKCALDKLSAKSGNAYTESISGMFLDMISE